MHYITENRSDFKSDYNEDIACMPIYFKLCIFYEAGHYLSVHKLLLVKGCFIQSINKSEKIQFTFVT